MLARYSRRPRHALAVAIATLAACSSDSALAPPSERLTPLSPTSLIGTVGEPVAQAPAVLVRDQRGSPRPGVVVRFVPVHGTVHPTEVVTDGTGTARVDAWVLAELAGAQHLQAAVDDARITFVAQARPAAPSNLTRVPPAPDIVGFPGEAVPTVKLLATDRFGNRVPDAPVTFVVAAGNGELAYATAKTDVRGEVATPAWRLGIAAGENLLMASVPGGESVGITATALDPAQVRWYELVTIRYEGFERSPEGPGITYQSSLALTSIDPCLCQGELGHFVERGVARTQFGSALLSAFGRFRVAHDGRRGILILQSLWDTTGSWLRHGSPWFEEERLIIERWDPWDIGLPEHWIYEPVHKD